MKNPKSMTEAELNWNRKDLNEVIAVQEAGLRQGVHCPKLGAYWDDLHAVLAEVRIRRGQGVC